jgi:hypothetical protein
MNTLKIKETAYQFASSWDEIPNRETALLLLQTVFNPKYTAQQKIYLAIQAIAPLAKMVQDYGRVLRQEQAITYRLAKLSTPKAKQIICHTLAPYFEWIFKPHLTKNIIQYLEAGKTKYILPTESLANVSLLQWSFAHPYLWAYLQSPKKEYIMHFLAILIQKEGEPFNPETYQKNLPLFESLPQYLSALLFEYIATQWNNLATAFQDIFEGSAKNNKSPDWNPVLFDLSKTSVFGDIDKTASQPLPTCLLYLRQEKINFEKTQKTS